MIPYVGLPITPNTAAVEAIFAGHAFVSAAHPQQLPLAQSMTQSFAVDNGAFPAWQQGTPIRDWSFFYRWVETFRFHPRFDWAVIPDVIDGTEQDNDALIEEWPFGIIQGVPVWHMHESLDRLKRLANAWPRIALGSSGDFKTVGSNVWWDRMSEAMLVICDEEGRPKCKLHGLRMLNPKIFTKLPLSSADSTNIGRNIGIDKNWKNAYPLPSKESRAKVMRIRLEASVGAERWIDPLFS